MPDEIQQNELKRLENHTQMNEHDLQRWQQHLAQLLRKKLIYGERNIQTDLHRQFETVLITEALHYTKGRKLKAAKLLGWGRNTLSRKLKELKLFV